METVTANLALSLRSRGHDVGITCIEEIGGVGRETIATGMRVSLVPAPGLMPNVVPRALGGWLRDVKPDVVHAHSGVWLKAVQAARWAGIDATVCTIHGIKPVEPWTRRWYDRIAARRTRRVVAVSNSVRDYLRRSARVPDRNLVMITNGVPLDAYTPGPSSPSVRMKLGIPPDGVVIGCVARFHPVKNHSLLIDAFAQVRQERPDAFLLLVGDGETRVAVEKRIESLGLSRYVRVTGVIDDTASVYREMDVFVLASLIEGTSISLLEAMAAGVPVVATAVGGNPDLLEGGRWGDLVPSGDAAGLARTILNVVECGAEYHVRAEAVRAHVVRNYSVDRMAEQYEAVYRDLCDGVGAGPIPGAEAHRHSGRQFHGLQSQEHR